MNDEAAFQDYLDAHPDDWHARMVFADWLDDRGDARAAGYREMGRCKLWAFCPDPIHYPSWCYWASEAVAVMYPDTYTRHALPAVWFAAVDLRGRGNQFIPEAVNLECGGMDEYPRRRVEDAAAVAYGKVLAGLPA